MFVQRGRHRTCPKALSPVMPVPGSAEIKNRCLGRLWGVGSYDAAWRDLLEGRYGCNVTIHLGSRK